MRNYYLQTLEGVKDTENIEVSPHVISSGHEYSIVEETDDYISYTDETGKLYEELKPKSSGLGWIVAAAAAFLLLG